MIKNYINKSNKINFFKNIIENIKPFFFKFKEKTKKISTLNKKEKLYLLHGETVLILKAINDSKSFEITYAVPPVYGNQVPIFFEIKNNKSHKTIKYRLADEKNHPNKIIKFKIAKMKKGENTKIQFDYWILVKNNDYKDLPNYVKIQNREKIPIDLKKWLNASKSIKSNNIFIKLIALFLRSFTNNQIKFADRVVYFSCYHRLFLGLLRKYLETTPTLHNIFLPNRYWTGLNDAVSYFLFGGLCCGKANFETALLRACNIPARVLITTTMYYGKKMWLDAQHRIIEFYFPNYGWVTAMSGRMPYQPKNFIILKIVYPEDENIAGNGLSYYGGAAPWFWISNENIIFDFPEKLINYGRLRGWGVPAIRGWIENKINIEECEANQVFNLTKNVWELYSLVVGKNFDEKENIFFKKAIFAQKKAIKYLNQSNIEKYIQQMNNALNNYKKLVKNHIKNLL